MEAIPCLPASLSLSRPLCSPARRRPTLKSSQTMWPQFQHPKSLRGCNPKRQSTRSEAQARPDPPPRIAKPEERMRRTHARRNGERRTHLVLRIELLLELMDLALLRGGEVLGVMAAHCSSARIDAKPFTAARRSSTTRTELRDRDYGVRAGFGSATTDRSNVLTENLS